jgi:hypothetical protein
MPNVDPDQGLVYPADPDAADNPSAFATFIGGMISRLNKRYTNLADRVARDLAPVENQVTALAAEDRFDVYDGVNYVSLEQRVYFATRRKAADSPNVNNSTALVNDADFVVALPAAGTFGWKQTSFYSCTAVADFKHTYTFPAGITNLKWGITGLSGAAAANPGDGAFDVITASAATAVVGGNGVGNLLRLTIEGEVTMGGTAGNMQFQYAQQNLEATNLVHRQGSRLQVWRIL